jgi:hypothetical protein
MAVSFIWFIAFGAYLLFVGEISRNELVTGCVLASFAAVWAYSAREISNVRFAASRRQIRPILRATAKLGPATARTGIQLLYFAANGGRLARAVQVTFESGAADDPADRSRRAIAMLGASLAPDRFVVNEDRGRSRVDIHEITRSGRDPEPEWLT